MVKKFINFIGKEISGLHEAAYFLALFSFLSLILGLMRDRLLAANFGASAILDVYYASFRLPDLLFVAVTSMVSASVLVPIFSQHLTDKKELKRYIDSLFTIFLVVMIFICLLVFILAPQILQLTAPGLITGEMSATLILFTRILLLSPILLGISQLFGGIVQAYRKFVLYAISPILYNFGIILGVVFLYPIFGEVGLILGVCLGLVFHLVVQLPAIKNYQLIPKITFCIDKKIIKKIVTLSLPRTIALASSQIILIVLIAIASKMETGSISVFNFAYNLQSVPMAIIGVSYSLAAFPTLARFFHEKRMEDFMASVVTSARHIIFWSLPIIFLFIVLRAQIVRTILGSGEFTWSDTRLTAAALALFIISALAQSLILLFVRAYYAAGQTRKPLFINTISSIFVIALSFVLVNFYQSSENMREFFEVLLRVDGGLPSSVLMLPLAFSIGTIFNVLLLWISFEKSFAKFTYILIKPFFQSIFASFIAGYVSYLFLNFFSNIFNLNKLSGIFSQGLFSGILGIIAGIIVLILFDNYELQEVWKTLHHKIWGAKAITSGQGEL